MQHSKVILVKVKYPSIKEIRRSIVDDMMSQIAKHKVQVKLDTLELYLVIDEALTNAMEHGNMWDKNKFVDIHISRNTSHLYITITDEGNGFKRRNSSIQHMHSRGRGIFIIKQFTKVTWNKKGNSITMAVPIHKRSR